MNCTPVKTSPFIFILSLFIFIFQAQKYDFCVFSFGFLRFVIGVLYMSFMWLRKNGMDDAGDVAAQSIPMQPDVAAAGTPMVEL